MKPSKTQVAILERLARGDVLILMGGGAPYFYWQGNYRAHHPRYDSVFRLKKMGFVKIAKEDWPTTTYVISAKGRNYLASFEKVG